MTDERWNKIMQGISMRIREMGLTLDLEGIHAVLREHWDTLHDEAALDSFISTQELVEMKAARDQQQVDLDKLKADIVAKEKEKVKP